MARFSRSRLRWHYRSRHEGLIAFSNREFYDGELFTFPSPAAGDRSVRFEHVPDGVYDRGGSRTNRVEARRVAEAVLERFEEYGHSRSLGVIALSMAQERAIDGELMRLKPTVPHLAPLFAEDREEPFFVKNLENVQGDERDHIIVSVGYGPDASGNLGLNFGPINRAAGERRLNVAVTRAKWQVTAVCSFLPHELDLAKLTTDNRGVVELQRYLQYAHGGPTAPEATAGGEPEADFEEAVKRELEEAGMSVDAQVGASGFRIDLAVRHPDNPGRHILGIECDGAQYHSSRTARGRDRLRQAVLERLGWRILRIWSLDWLNDPRFQVDRVLEEVERSRRGEVSDEAAATGPSSEPERETDEELKDDGGSDEPDATREVATIELPDYVEYEPAESLTTEEFQAARHAISGPALERLISEVKRIVDVESPIHKRAVERRLASTSGPARSGKAVRETVDYATRNALVRKVVATEGDFLVATDGRPISPRRRPGAAGHPIEEVAVEEIAEVIRMILDSHYGMPEDGLATEAARLLGYGRASAKVKTRMQLAVKHLEAKRLIDRQGDDLVLSRGGS